MVDAYMTQEEADAVKVERARLFQTSKLLGRTITLVLWRDEDQAPPAGAVGPQQVLLIIGQGRASRNRGDAVQTTTNTGEFRKEQPFDVMVGDRFTLPETYQGLGGVSGVISEPPVDAGSFIRAPFVLEG